MTMPILHSNKGSSQLLLVLVIAAILSLTLTTAVLRTYQDVKNQTALVDLISGSVLCEAVALSAYYRETIGDPYPANTPVPISFSTQADRLLAALLSTTPPVLPPEYRVPQPAAVYIPPGPFLLATETFSPISPQGTPFNLSATISLTASRRTHRKFSGDNLRTVTPVTASNTSYCGDMENAGQAHVCLSRPNPVSCSIVASPATVAMAGDASLLTMTMSGEVTTADLDGINVLPPVGTKSVNPLAVANYVGTVVGPTGIATCNASVAVATPCTAGTLDPSFGNAGKVLTNLGTSGQRVLRIRLLPDGRFYAAGDHGPSDCASSCKMVVARYQPNGNLDLSFNGTGFVARSIGGGMERVRGMAVQPDGKVVLAGKIRSSGRNNSWVVRMNTDGTLDSSFGGDGIQITSLSPEDDTFFSVAVQPDGKVVAVGSAGNDGADISDLSFARYLSNGTLDPSFSGDGQFRFGIGSTGRARDVVIQPDGKIVAAGFAKVGGNVQFVVARLTTSGDPDTSFNGTGYATADFLSGYDRAFAVALQTDGKIVAVGSTRIAGRHDFAAIRLNPDGSFDNSFNSDGKVIVPLGNDTSDDDIGYGVTIDAAGNIIMVGTGDSGPSFDFLVARLLPNGNLDPAFNGNGRLSVPISASGDYYDSAHAVVIQPADGKILVGGIGRNGRDKDFAIIRVEGCVF